MKITKLQLAGLAVAAVAVAALPTAGVFAEAANTTINATIGSTITITTSGTVAINDVQPAGDAKTGDVTVTVTTNNSSGYNLTIKDADTNLNLVSDTNNIAAHSGSHDTPTAFAAGASVWGYRLASYPAGQYAGITAAEVELKTTSAPAASDVTTVTFGVQASGSQPSGEYTGIVTYTAVVNS